MDDSHIGGDDPRAHDGDPASAAPTRHPTYRSHLIPRTRDGKAATLAFLALFALVMPPFTHTVLNRVDPEIAGVPFLYWTLLVLYTLLIGVLLWAHRKGV